MEQPLDLSQLTKQYYTIGEVAEMLGVSIELLRNWEKQFPKQIHPMRTGGNTRLYNKKQIEKIVMIKRNLREVGMTVKGTKKVLAARQTEEEIKQEVITQLCEIRRQIQAIVDEM